MENNKTANRDIFEKLPVPKAVMKMALPTILGQLTVLLYNIADTFFIGRTNNPCMVAGASLLLPVYNLCVAVSNLTGQGGGTVISRMLGRGETEKAGQVSAFSFWTAIGMALLISILTAVFRIPLLRFLGAGEDVFGYASQYAFCVLTLGAVPTVIGMLLSTLLRSNGFSKQAGFGVTLGGIVNMALDPLFMFVLLPEGYEVLGAGIATLLSNIIVNIYFFIVLRKLNGKTVLRFSPRLGLPEKAVIRSLFLTGLPSSVMNLGFDAFCLSMNRLMAAYGNTALAAVGIVMKAERFPMNINIGIFQGMVPIIAYNYAAGNRERMHETLRFSRRTAFLIAIGCIGLYHLAAPYVMRFFIAESETVTYGTLFLRLRIMGTPVMAMSVMHTFFFQAVGKGKTALILVIMRWVLIGLPTVFLMDRLFGMYGVVLAQLVSDGLTAVVCLLAYRSYNKKDAYLPLNQKP